MKRLFSVCLIAIFFLSCVSSGYGYSAASEFLCEIGLKFYKLGRYDEALHEFKKALLVQPNYEPALKYIQMIEQMKEKREEKEKLLPYGFTPSTAVSSKAIKEYLDLIEIQRETVKGKGIEPSKVSPALPGKAKALAKAATAIIEEPKILTIQDALGKIQQPIEIERGKSIILSGKNIQRFLLTRQDIMTVERKSANELLITGKNIGYTYLHIWDENGRQTLEFLGVLPKPKGPTLEEEMRLEEESSGAFKLRYALSWNAYAEGKRLSSLKRKFYSWHHNLNLTGSTPYGNVDSTAIVSSLKESTDLTYFTLGLTEGKIGPFKGFSWRGFDFSPAFSNLAMGGASLRGGMLQSPAFNKKIDYTVFRGRESTGKYGNLSPGLPKPKQSFLEGLDVNYNPKEGYNYGFSIAHGYGRDRLAHLNSYAYDADANWHIGKWGYRYEIGYDSETLAHLFTGNYTRPRLRFLYELRNINKNFISINGGAWRRGELGGLFTLNLKPTDDLRIDNRLDIYQDRLFPSPENDNRWNEDYDFNATYTLSPTAYLRMNYTLQNELGKIYQSRYQGVGMGLNKSFNLIRKINTFLDYRNRQRKNYTNPSSDYINDNITAGLRFNLIWQFNFFLTQQWNWLQERYEGNRSLPQVLETGVDLSSQILKSKFYENLRFMYRNEKNTGSNLSFLSGEDYIEGYAELSYRPTDGTEAYCSTRVRNIWPHTTNIVKRIEADFNIGMRYLWDTGIRWESVGTIEGYVFRDLNSDGLRQRDEAPVEGVKIWLGKNKSTTTDLFGYYKFTKVKGKRVYVVIDTQSLPSGFVLTVPPRQEISMVQSQTARADFGIISRSEISGFVFYDTNNNQEYNAGEKGIGNVVITLENGMKAVTASDGRYSFRNASVGEHTITLKMNTLPQEYLPKVPIIKEMTLFEGMTYYYNIPLKKARE